HTHDTRAMAIANILAAMEHGVTNFDASIGGLGGWPFAPGASGNVCTEDLVHCLHALGVQTGIDLDPLLGVSRRVQEIVGRAVPGQSAIQAPAPQVPRGARTRLESTDYLARTQARNPEEAGPARQIKVSQADALGLLPVLPRPFDFVLIDAAKDHYLD